MSRVCGNRRSGDAVSSLFYNNAVHVWNILYLSVRLMLLSQISVKESTIFIYIYMWLIIMNIDICSQRTTGLYFFSRLQMKYNYTCMPYYGTTFSNSLFIRLVPSFFENFADLFFCLLSFFLLFLVCLSECHFPLVGVFPLFPVITWTYKCMYNLSFLWRSIKVKII